MANRQANTAPMYIVSAAIIGIGVGIVAGAILDNIIPGRRILAVLCALAAVGAEYLARRYLAGRMPRVFSHEVAAASPSLMFIAVVIALAGGLATHDLALIWNVMAGPVLGGVSGLFAGLMTAVLVVLREEEHGARPGQVR